MRKLRWKHIGAITLEMAIVPLSLLTLIALWVGITADEIVVACALLFLIVVAVWVRSRRKKRK